METISTERRSLIEAFMRGYMSGDSGHYFCNTYDDVERAHVIAEVTRAAIANAETLMLVIEIGEVPLPIAIDCSVRAGNRFLPSVGG